MPDIVTLVEFKTHYNISGATYDALWEQLRQAAGRAVTMYTGRDFEAYSATPAEREFQYDGSGFLDIDDAATVTQVKLESTTLDPNSWTAQRDRLGEPYHYIELPPRNLISPEMGFTYNLDVFLADASHRRTYIKAYVTGTWGWATIPWDVKQAAFEIMDAMRPRGFGGSEGELQAEAIADYSRSWATSQAEAVEDIPFSAQQLLAPYRRVGL